MVITVDYVISSAACVRWIVDAKLRVVEDVVRLKAKLQSLGVSHLEILDK